MRRFGGSWFALIAFTFMVVFVGACSTDELAGPPGETPALVSSPTPQAANVCTGSEPGVPIPLSKEQEYILCEQSCLPSSPRTYCDALCCLEVTTRPGVNGCEQCYFQ